MHKVFVLSIVYPESQVSQIAAVVSQISQFKSTHSLTVTVTNLYQLLKLEEMLTKNEYELETLTSGVFIVIF